MYVHSASLKGKRENNEDSHTILLNLNNKDPSKAAINIYAVYDGHGYAGGGKLVSKYLADNMPKFFMDKRVSFPLKDRYIDTVYTYIQNKLEQQFGEKIKTSGSTCLMICHYSKSGSDFLDVMNTGDCRAVICNGNRGLPLTKDHKPNWPEELARIRGLGGEPSFDGADWRIGDLSVSRAFGDLDAAKYVTYKPEIFRYKLSKDDKFIVLACDGLWDVLDSQQAVNFVLHYVTNNGTKSNIAKKLAEHAISLGSTDNVSVLIIFLKPTRLTSLDLL